MAFVMYRWIIPVTFEFAVPVALLCLFPPRSHEEGPAITNSAVYYPWAHQRRTELVSSFLLTIHTSLRMTKQLVLGSLSSHAQPVLALLAVVPEREELIKLL